MKVSEEEIAALFRNEENAHLYKIQGTNIMYKGELIATELTEIEINKDEDSSVIDIYFSFNPVKTKRIKSTKSSYVFKL